MTVNPVKSVLGSIWVAGYILAGMPAGRAATLGDAVGAPVPKVKLVLDSSVVVGGLATTRLGCVRNEYSGGIV
jgi:hypothetical protein